MEIKGKVHCMFEQSGTFKREFIKLGYEAEDYDIQNNFGETDHVIDLFAEIESAYRGGQSVFDDITPDDLILAFFPCIYFCDAKVMMFKCVSTHHRNWSLERKIRQNIEVAETRQLFYTRLLQLVAIVSNRNLRLIIENPWNTSGETYLQHNFLAPTIIDRNRTVRGDYFVKPTAYWFIGCENTYGYTEQRDKEVKIVYKVGGHGTKTGQCDAERSMISPDYARNFICDFVLGKVQRNTQLELF